MKTLLLNRQRSIAACLYLLATILSLTLSSTLWAQSEPTFPSLTGRVTDQAKLLSSAQKAELEQKLAAHEAATSNQIVVVTVKSLEGFDIADYALKLGRKWGIGTEEKNNGVLLVVAPNERKVRIEVGYGLEGALPDGLAGTIIRGNILPSFRESDYPRGINNGVTAIEQAIAGEYTPPANIVSKQDRPSTTFEKFFPLIFISFIGLTHLTRRRFPKRNVANSSNPKSTDLESTDSEFGYSEFKTAADTEAPVSPTPKSNAEKAANAIFPAGFAGMFVALGSSKVMFGVMAAVLVFVVIFFFGSSGTGGSGGRRGGYIGDSGMGGGSGGGFSGGGGGFGGGGASGSW